MKKSSFNENWTVRCLTRDETPKQVSIPHDAMISEPRTPDSRGEGNIGWYIGGDYEYTKKFDVPAECEAQKIVFEFEGVYQQAEVYINGEKAGYRPYGYTNFYVEANDFLKYGEENEIRVIAKNSDQPNSRWYSGTGIYRPVNMWTSDKEKYIVLNGVKVKTVDYKTGKKDFDYCDVINGVGLQMLLYLFALERGEYGTAAGVQYFPARVPLLSADGKLTDAEAEELRRKEWVRKGLLLRDETVLDAMDPEDWSRLCAKRKKDGTLSGDLADREQLKMLRSYIFQWLANMVDDIAAGNVEANPYTRGTSHDACAFCPYGSICHKETVEGRRNYKALKAEEFWAQVEKEVNRHG